MEIRGLWLKAVPDKEVEILMTEESDDVAAIFTTHDVAEFLRVDTSVIETMLVTGELRGFRVGQEWRVIGLDLIAYLRRSLEKEQKATLARNLKDPKFWASEVAKHPEFRRQLENSDHAPGTFGAFLKQGLDAREAESRAENVVEFPRKDRT